MSSEFWSADEFDRQAQSRYESGDYEGATTLLEAALALYPGSADLWVTLGYTQLAREEFALARRAFDMAMASDPNHEDGLVGLGEALLKLGERSRGFRAFDRVLELGFERDLDLMLSIGRALFREELFEQAERFFRKAVAAHERSAEAAADLAYTVLRRGQPVQARVWLKRALALDPDNHEARICLANLCYDAGNRKRSLEEFECVPPARLWDPLTVWRVIELTRAFRSLSANARELDPYLQRLEQLLVVPSPEERLFAELETRGDPVGVPARSQLDMFRPDPPEGADEAVDGSHAEDRPDVASEGRPDAASEGSGGANRGRNQPHRMGAAERRGSAGDWAGIVQAMCQSSPQPQQSIEQYMRDTARRVHNLTGILIPDHDPEAFLRASAQAGVLHIDH